MHPVWLRVPSANVGDIQNPVDAVQLGIIVPMVETVQEARSAVMFAKFPVGNRDNPEYQALGSSQLPAAARPAPSGAGDQATNANNNIMIMISPDRSPAGVGISVDNILEEVEGIDIVMAREQRFRPARRRPG